MKKFFIITFCLFSASVFPQMQFSQTQLDSIYSQFMIERGIKNAPGIVPGNSVVDRTDSAKIKCGLGSTFRMRYLFNQFSPEQQNVLSKILTRPSSDTSIVSPKGYFRIHFYKTGTGAPSYDVNQAAVAADSAYDFEVNYLDYPAPPPDNGLGGDDKYDIYISNLGNIYGQTTPENETSPNSSKYESYLEVDNDFAGFYTTGINAFRVTVAHEFHHAIQVGNYIFKTDSQGNIQDQYFYELTSTSMEIFVYTSIPDYVGYLSSLFNNPDQGFGLHDGYDLAIWNLYLKMNYGYDIIKKQWQLFESMPALNAINTSLSSSGTDFGNAFRGFGIWCYFTNYRSVAGKYFPLSSRYPVIRPVSKIIYTPPMDSVRVNTNAATNNYLVFSNNTDTVVSIVSNGDYQAGVDNPGTFVPFTYVLYSSPNIGDRKLSAQYSAILNVTNSSVWKGSEILNGLVVNSDSVSNKVIPVELEYAYPQPFYYKQGINLTIPAPVNNNGMADLNIYSVSMDLKYSSTLQIYFIKDKPVVQWNGKSNSNQKLASGVYIYITKSGDEVVKGKLVIFNE